MRKFVIAGVVAGLLVPTLPSASAHPHYHYTGGCGYAAVNDTTPNQTMGGREQWNGIFYIVAIATRADGTPALTARIDVECRLLVNNVEYGYVLTAWGTGIAVAVDQFAYNAAATDVITVCETVWVENERHDRCRNATVSPVVPEPVIQLLDLALDLADPLLCPLLDPLAPGIQGVVEFDPASRDLSVAGGVVYDCPPYNGGTHAPVDILEVLLSDV